MLHYAMAHWRGQHGLVQSTLINCLGSYVLLVLVFFGFAAFFTSQAFLGVALCTFSVWQIWVSVGILRAGARRTFDPSAPPGPRLGGAIAMIAVLAAGIYSIRDAVYFFG
jgi:hypothetical protein